MAIRPDPLDLHPKLPDERRSRKSASHLRGFRLLPQGIFPAAHSRNSFAQTFTTGVEALVALDTVVHDTCADDAPGQATAAMVDTVLARLTIRYAGIYTVLWALAFAQSAGGTTRQARLKLNATTFIGRGNNGPLGGVGFPVSLGAIERKFKEGDFLEVFGFQNAGGNLDSDVSEGMPYLSASWKALFSGAP